MSVAIEGLAPPGVEPAFAFFVVRLDAPVDRDGLLEALRALAPLIPDVDAFIGEFPVRLEGRLQLVAIPWLPPEDDAGAREQAELVARAAALGVAAAWFFATGDHPPRAYDLAFPLDDRPEPEPNNLGLAIKLAGDGLEGENTVLLAFHTLWLAPYEGRYRDTAIAIDREHRAAQLWACNLVADGAAEHLLWIASQLHRVMPIVHARFATRGDDAFVLAGNPLRTRYRDGGEPAVDAWLAEQACWSDDEAARMLCELAADIAAGREVEPDGHAHVGDDGSDVTQHAGELLVARARSGRLSTRVLPALVPVIARHERVAELAGVIGARSAVPALVDALGSSRSPAPAAALGAIGDPAAAPVLVAVMASDAHAPSVRVAAARALAFGPLAAALSPASRAEAARAIAELAREPLVAACARALAGEPVPELAELVHAELTGLADDHAATIARLRAALDVATAFPEHVRAEDLVWLTRFAEPELRAAAHALLARLGAPMPFAPVFDATAARAIGELELIDAIADPHVVGRGALIDEAGRRAATGARRAIIGACSEVIARARPDTARLLHHDARVLAAGVAVLRTDLAEDTIALFDRMLRNANVHVKSDLMRDPPIDARLIGGMFHVVGEHWGWQEPAAKRWLARFAGTDAYETERARAHVDDEETN